MSVHFFGRFRPAHSFYKSSAAQAAKLSPNVFAPREHSYCYERGGWLAVAASNRAASVVVDRPEFAMGAVSGHPCVQIPS